MKKYIQLTAGRGPAECARAVALVARELLKDFPDAELVESEPQPVLLRSSPANC